MMEAARGGTLVQSSTTRFDSLTAGRVFQTQSCRVTAPEILEFATRYDPQWFHTDPVRAGSSRWDGLIASGWHTCSVAMRLAVDEVLGASDSIGSPGVERIRWLSPLRPDMEVRLRMEVLEQKRSRSGRYGVVRWRWILACVDGDVLLELILTNLFDPQLGSDGPKGRSAA